MKILFVFLFFVLLLFNCQEILQTQDSTGQKLKLIFASCFAFDRQQQHGPISLFHNISKHKPDVFAWTGDAAYVYNISQAQQLFDSTTNDSGYQALLHNNRTTIIGQWDDHDYGINDGDKSHLHKDYMKNIYLDFIKEDKQSKRRSQEGGIYVSYYLGQTKQIKLVMLDNRYSKDPPTQQGNKDMLGEAQWKWLEQEFQDPNASIILLTSGVQLLPDDRLVIEQWYQESRQRLFHLLKKYSNSKRVVILSGDVHFAELLFEPDSLETIGYNLVEIASSGISHSLGYSQYPWFFINTFLPNTYSDKEHRLFDLNYGLADIEINMEDKSKTKLHFKIYDKHDDVKLEINFNPWMNQSEQLYSKSIFSRKHSYILRWIVQVFKNYFIDYWYLGWSVLLFLFFSFKISIMFYHSFTKRILSYKQKYN